MRYSCRTALLSLLIAVLTAAFPFRSVAQGSRQNSPYDPIEEKDRDHPDARAAWFLRGRIPPNGESGALLRYRAYLQKLQSRARTFASLPLSNNNTSSSGWQPLGPAPMISLAAGTSQDYNFVSGRATAIAIDPADSSGNTVFIGGAHGGVWKSTNAATLSPSPSAVTWAPLADYAGTLAVGAIAIQPGNNNPANSVVLVGTGEPNSSGDSYYGLGILRSTNGGSSWTLITSAATGQSFAGLGFSKIAFSSQNPNLVVAAAATAYTGVELGIDTSYPANRGLYYSTNGGASWSYVTAITDPGGTVSADSATSVIYDATANKFLAAIRYHGIYGSSDGVNWTRLTNQPANLTTTACPVNPANNNKACPLYRTELTAVPQRDEVYAWVFYYTTDTQGNRVENDGGIWQGTSSGATWRQIGDTNITNCGDPYGCGVHQGAYNLEALALPNGSVTDLYVGAINIYKCTITNLSSPSCSFQNLTHVYGCSNVARVHPDQHHLAGVIANGKEVMYFANDGGIYRALDGYTGLTAGSCGGTNQFDSLNQTIGSMTQFVSFSIHPSDPTVLLGGTQDNGSPTTNSSMPTLEWQNVHPGDGGYNIINLSSPNDWFASYPDGGQNQLEIDHCGSGTGCTASSFNPVVLSSDLSGDDGAFYFPYVLDPQSSSTMLIGTCRVWRVANATSPTGYAVLSPGFEPGGPLPCTGNEVNTVRSLAAGGPKDSNGFSKVIYAGTDGLGPVINARPAGGHVWRTLDASVASPVFSDVTGSINPGVYPISAIASDPSDSTGQTAYAAIMGFHVSHFFKTTNAGSTWTDFTGSLPDAPVNSAVIDSQAGIIYVGTDVGVFQSPTAAPNWVEVGPQSSSSNSGFLPNVPVTALRLFSSGGTKLLRASTYGRGVWQYALATTPDYVIAISNSPLTVFGSQTSTLSGSLTATGGYNSAVTLTCAGGTTTPPTTCTPPSPVTPSTTGAPFSTTVGGAIGDYTFNIHGVGADSANVTHDASVTLHVVDFGLGTLSASSIDVGQGNSSSAVNFTVSASGSFNGTVSLSCSGLPSGATCTFSPSANVQPTSGNSVQVTMTVNASLITPLGTSGATLSATTTGAPAAKTQAFSVIVHADYQLAITNPSVTAPINTSGTFSGTLTSANYSSSVNLSCGSGAPPTCSVVPPSVTPTSAGAPFTVSVQSNNFQTYNFNVNALGTDAAQISHAAAVSFNSTFQLQESTTSQTVKAGQTATYNLTVSLGAAPSPAVITFACAGLPYGAGCSFNPSQLSAGGTGNQPVTLTVTTMGPNSAAAARPVTLSGIAILWIPLAGLLLPSYTMRCKSRRRWLTILTILMAASLLVTLTSCGSGGSGGGGGGSVSVAVSPTTASLFPTQTQQFSATVSGTSNTAISWSASPGSINANGLYTAPNSVSQNTQATVTATSEADVTKSGAALVTVKAPTPSGAYTIQVTATSGSGSNLIAETTTAALTVQ